MHLKTRLHWRLILCGLPLFVVLFLGCARTNFQLAPSVTSSSSPSNSNPTNNSIPTSGGTGAWTHDLDASHAALGMYTVGDSGYLVATPAVSSNMPYGFSVYDELGNVISALTATQQSDGTWTYVLPTSRYGYFEIRPTEGTAAALVPAIGSRPAGVLTYAVLPAPDTNPSNNFQDEFTNIEGTTLEPGFNALGTGTYPWLGYSTYGISNYSWGVCEPNQATAAADCAAMLASDPNVAIIQNSKLIPLFYMNTMPLWATASTNGSAFGYPPADFAAYTAYLQYIIPKIVSSYSFVPVRKYQITWEPNDGWGWMGTDAEFIQLYQVSYNTIKALDPNAKILGPTLANLGPAMTSQFTRLLGLGLGNYLDGVTSHPYPAYSQIYGLDDGWIADFRSLATTSMGRVIPFYATESGLSTYEMGLYGSIPVNNNYNVYHAVGNIAMALLEKNDGASMHTYFYTADYSSQPLYGLFYNATTAYTYGPDKVSPKVDVPMIRQANTLLNHSIGVGQWVSPGGNSNLEAFVYQNKHSSVYTAVLWDPSGNNGTVSFQTGASQVTEMDAFGNATTVNTNGGVLNLTLSIEPLYIQGLGTGALSVLTASGAVGN